MLQGYTRSPVQKFGLPEVEALHTRNGQDMAKSAWVIHLVSPAPRGKAGEVHICASHIKVKVSKDQEVYSYASKPISFYSLLGPIYAPSKLHVSSMHLALPGVLPQCLSLTWLSLVCQSSWVLGSSKKHQYTTRIFCCLSLFGFPINGAQLYNERWTNFLDMAYAAWIMLLWSQKLHKNLHVHPHVRNWGNLSLVGFYW